MYISTRPLCSHLHFYIWYGEIIAIMLVIVTTLHYTMHIWIDQMQFYFWEIYHHIPDLGILWDLSSPHFLCKGRIAILSKSDAELLKREYGYSLFCGSCTGGMCHPSCGVYVECCCDYYRICRIKIMVCPIMDFVGLTSDSLTTFTSVTLICCLLYT